MPKLRVPPGRAGRLWLRHRLDTATAGVTLLEQKLRALQGQERRLTGIAHVTGQEWRARAGEAETWLLRAALAGGQRARRLAVAHEPAHVAVTWATTMGVRYPAETRCELPPAHPPTTVVGTALLRAEAAYRTAVQAAARHAAAQAAVRLVRAEVATTRQRVRALRRHWIPQLRDALTRMERGLDEQERDDHIRRRWATGHDT